MIAATRRPPWPRGAWIPWAFVLFFVVVTAVNAVMIWVAVESWTGLSSGDSYEQGLRYNQNLEAAQRQAELGWQPRLTARRLGSDQAEAELRLSDRQGQPVTDAVIEASFERPVQPDHDVEVELKPVGPGQYRAGFALPAVGVWDAHVVIRRGDDRYVLQQRLMLR